MGNEQSHISGIDIDPKAIEVSDFWAQHNASINNLQNTSKLSLFIGDLFINEPFWLPQTPLESFSKNLMLYRHPSIIKYISSWQKANKFHLAVEEITPLSHVINQMSGIEISLGLYSILKALCFLHEKANVSHNNLCLASIFVSKDGNWKLGGLEYLCPYKNLTAEYLKKSRSHRYSKAVDTNEDKHLKDATNSRKDFIDCFAFCVFALEVLKGKSDDNATALTGFKEFCTEVVQEPNILQRPKLSSLLEHEFFKLNKFINIYSYLIEVPLKSDTEKTEFFTNLKRELEELDEYVVASQLGQLLVSRMVLLNKAAKDYLLPYILVPRKGESSALFSDQIFKKYIAPHLLKIFGVRDAQIRLLLLEYFPHFIDCFSKEELQLHILPELLVGIKDTNNDLVSATLHTLAELVPVLGADVVIGGKRGKLFNDGRPKHHSVARKGSKTAKQEPIQSISVPVNDSSISSSSATSNLPERPRPDGEEGETSTEEIEPSAEEDNENWEDWDTDNIVIPVTGEEVRLNDLSVIASGISLEEVQNGKTSSTTASSKLNRKLVDITELDIKNQAKIEMEQNEIDFFEDMEPVIETSSKFLIEQKESANNSDAVSSKLSANVHDEEEGWGDEWE